MKILLYIRVEQLKSLIRDPNSYRMYRVALFMMFYFLCIFSIWTFIPLAYFSAQAVFILILHLFRNDYKLLKKMGLSVYSIILIEYLCLSLPTILAGFILNQSLGLFILLAFTVLLPWTRPDKIVRFLQFFNQPNRSC